MNDTDVNFRGHTCQETPRMLGNMPLKCGAPAVALVQHRCREEGPYFMCAPCADHNIHNRNGFAVAIAADADPELKVRWMTDAQLKAGRC